MRWDNLFHDLETQLDAEVDAAHRDREREKEREAIAQSTLAQMLRRLKEQTLVVEFVLGDYSLEGQVESVGRDWIAAEIRSPGLLAGYAIVPFPQLSAILLAPEQVWVASQAFTGQSASDATQGSTRVLSLLEKIPVRIVLRDLCRRRRQVVVVTRGAHYSGTLDRVAADYLEIACHQGDVARRQADVSRLAVIPLDAVLLVRILD